MPLLVTLEYPPQKGGVATYLAGEVAASPDVVRVIRAQDFFWDKWPHWLPLLWSIRPEKESMLWISHLLPAGYVAVVWKWRFKTPYRVYVHGLDLVAGRRSSWKRFWASLILKYADEIVANSNATRALLSHYGIDPVSARVSYPRIPEVNVDEYRGKAAELRKKYALGNRPVLLTISRLVSRKGIHAVLRALPEVWKHMPELAYVVVGNGPERPNLERAGQGGHVIFAGEVSDEEKYAWLSACSCFILTPVDDPNDFEGYGIVYKEAQMFGKPVIGSRVGGVPEAVGGNGVLVEPGNVQQITQAILKHVQS